MIMKKSNLMRLTNFIVRNANAIKILNFVTITYMYLKLEVICMQM